LLENAQAACAGGQEVEPLHDDQVDEADRGKKKKKKRKKKKKKVGGGIFF
jgi:hypothetical protein